MLFAEFLLKGIFLPKARHPGKYVRFVVDFHPLDMILARPGFLFDTTDKISDACNLKIKYS